MREELGVDVVSVGAVELIVDDPGSPFAIVFVPVAIVGTPICHEHSACAWLTLAEAVLLPLAPSDRRFVDVRLGRSTESGPAVHV